MENWVRRIAQAYGVSYDAFLKHALGRTGRGARDLDDITDTQLTRLSAGTGVSVERLREMNAAAMMRRVNEQIEGWLLSESGREALEELRATLGRMARRREAYATADAGRLARQNWDLYRA
jgi:hypothetical protein